MKNFKADYFSRQKIEKALTNEYFLQEISKTNSTLLDIVRKEIKENKNKSRHLHKNCPEKELKDIVNDEQLIQLQEDDEELENIKKNLSNPKYSDFFVQHDKLYHFRNRLKRTMMNMYNLLYQNA